jgi:hypothetical protein
MIFWISFLDPRWVPTPYSIVSAKFDPVIIYWMTFFYIIQILPDTPVVSWTSSAKFDLVI